MIRRYSDFTWLSGELSREFPGVIVPPLPEKQSVGRFTVEFIESRRRALEKFLHRIAMHNELGNSQYFVIFLQASDAGLTEAKNEAKTLKAKGGGSSMGWLEGTVNTLTSGKVILFYFYIDYFKCTFVQTELEKSAADLKIEEISQYVAQLEKQLANVTKHSEALVKRNREISQAYLDFGQSFALLGQTEGDCAGAALAQVFLECSSPIYFIYCITFLNYSSLAQQQNHCPYQHRDMQKLK